MGIVMMQQITACLLLSVAASFCSSSWPQTEISKVVKAGHIGIQKSKKRALYQANKKNYHPSKVHCLNYHVYLCQHKIQ